MTAGRAHELLLDERYGPNGERERIHLLRDGNELCVRVGEGAQLPLPTDAVRAVFARFGRAIDPALELVSERFELADGTFLTRLRHRARYDVIARDYLVWLPRQGEALVELATSVSAALVHLARANAELRTRHG